MTFCVQSVFIVVALALKKMQMSLGVLIVAWGSIRRQVGIRVNCNRNSLFVTHRIEELLSGMLVMCLFGHLELDLGSWNYV